MYRKFSRRECYVVTMLMVNEEYKKGATSLVLLVHGRRPGILATHGTSWGAVSYYIGKNSAVR